VSGCGSGGSTSEGPLRSFGLFGVLAPSSDPASALTFGTLGLCSDDTVTITGATTIESIGGAQVVALGHRPNPIPAGGYSLGMDPRPPSTLGFDTDSFEHPAGCDPPAPDGPELAIQVERGPSRTAASFVNGVRVDYTYNGEPRSLDVPWRLGWCGTGEPDICSTPMPTATP
jgi:hypothetical protein